MKKRWLSSILSGALAVGVGASASAQEMMPSPFSRAPSCGAPGCEAPGSEGPPCDPGYAPYSSGKIWIRAEYLLWKVRGADTPPLLTSGPLDVVGPSGIPGVLGQPTTQILLGADPLEYDISNGGRATLGWWFDCSQCLGMEGSFLQLDRQHSNNVLSSAGTPNTIPLSLPFFNLVEGVEDSTGIAFPGEGGFSGGASAFATTELWGAECNGLLNVISAPGWRVNLLGGARYLNIKESITFTTTSQFLPPDSPDIYNTIDHFGCENTFYGGQIGFRSDFRARLVSIEVTGKVAFGRMERETTIAGQLSTNDFTDGAAFETFPGGYLALPTNIGFYKDSRFAVVPELTVQLGWHPYDWCRLFAGYTLLYATHVARPGDQIDRAINITQAPAYTSDPDNTLQGAPAPLFRNIDASWWAQGLNLGFELRF